MSKSTLLIRALGPIVAFLFSWYGAFSPEYTLLGIAFWMMIWWMSETVHLAVTALLPLLLFPLFGITEAKSMGTYYAHPLVYLFFGGFVLALALEKTKLHYRIALWILRKTGTGNSGLLLGFMLATGCMSMWISNTATSIMMLPIATSVLAVLPKAKSEAMSRPILLSIAWSANIGGMATLIGTPPNMIFAGFLSDQFSREIGFVEWLPIGLSASLLIGTVAYVLLRRSLPATSSSKENHDTAAWIQTEWERLGGLTPVQKRVAIIFVGTLSEHIAWSDTGISLLSAVLLFSLTAEQKPILEWSDTTALPWGILVLFGGGLALAGTLQSSVWFDHMGQFLQSFQGASVFFWLLVMAVLGVFATEFLSNMALVSAMLPLVLTLSVAFDIPMELLALPLVLGASCAFMLPMATPPNAIVFSTGKLTVPYMMARGVVLNVIAVAVLTALAYALSFMG
jgi:sodium-dependent dicarboxylate transporter 2/3/5